jgi:membrane dipeptidase
MLGNSIAVFRQYHALGVRYLSLTHVCHNVFADSSGYPVEIEPLHGGLRFATSYHFDCSLIGCDSALGRSLIEEMNRLGVLVDLSHASDETAIQALNHSKAPVIWSHSSARALRHVSRNVPDDILRLIGTGDGQKDGIIMVSVPYRSMPCFLLHAVYVTGHFCSIFYINKGECNGCSRCRPC